MESVDQTAEPVPTDALDTVAYLARSPNRVRILDALADAPATRRALTDATGASRTTPDRIVNEFEDRGWAERDPDGRYVATATGRALVDALDPALDAVTAIHHLGDAVAWLPRDELDIGLEHFSDARLRRPENDDPVETGRYFADLIREADEFRVMSEWAPPEALAGPMHEEIVAGDLDATFVVTSEVSARVFEDPGQRERWREMLSTNAESWLVDGQVPCNLFVFDDTVLLKSSGPDAVQESYGVPIESTNPRVREWALELFEQYREDGARVTPDALAE